MRKVTPAASMTAWHHHEGFPSQRPPHQPHEAPRPCPEGRPPTWHPSAWSCWAAAPRPPQEAQSLRLRPRWHCLPPALMMLPPPKLRASRRLQRKPAERYRRRQGRRRQRRGAMVGNRGRQRCEAAGRAGTRRAVGPWRSAAGSLLLSASSKRGYTFKQKASELQSMEIGSIFQSLEISEN